MRDLGFRFCIEDVTDSLGEETSLSIARKGQVEVLVMDDPSA
jgi:hypothetical protein